uniref:Saposin B-type domain-containing protein n=1 Tax=Rhabditophanes sp. KR3021 TaxID=114890 RepID=A0AC35U0Y8_9BILA
MKLFAFFFVFMLMSSFALASEKCKLCKKTVTELEKYVNAHEGSAAGAEDVVCDIVSDGISILKSLCEELLKKEVDHLLKGIEHKESPEKICKDVHFC